MKLQRILVAGLAFATIAPYANAQDRRRTDDDRERIEELRSEISRMQRELRELQGDRVRAEPFMTPRAGGFSFGMPGTAWATGGARMGVTVQSRADRATDSIGAVLETVEEDSPAEAAGLQAGDIITRFGNESLPGRYPPASDRESAPAIKLIDLVREQEPGDTVTVTYRRGRETRTASVVLGEPETAWTYTLRAMEDQPGVRVFPSAPRVGMSFSAPDVFFISGGLGELELVTLNADLGRYFNTTEGVLVVSIGEESTLGLRSGDVILEIGGRVVDEPSRVFRVLGTYEPGEAVRMDVMRDRQRTTVNGTIPEREGRVRRGN